MTLHDGWAQFIELLAVGGGRVPVGSIPAHLSASDGDWEPMVVLTIRPEPSRTFSPQNVMLTKAQAERLLEDVKRVLEHDPLLPGTITEE
jgi:hypothetical protein